jgi:hypothetical protein
MSHKLTVVIVLMCLSILSEAQNLKTFYPLPQYKISQQNDPAGLSYFTTPLYGNNSVQVTQDSPLFFMVAYPDHLAVFNKRTDSCKLFTPANGYPFVNEPIRFQQNYSEKFAFAGSTVDGKDTADDVIIFDKVRQRVNTMKITEYKKASAKWKKESYRSKEERWYIANDDYRFVTRRNLRNNKRVQYAIRDAQMGRITALETYESKLYIAYKTGIGIFDTNHQRPIRYNFPLPEIKAMRRHGNEFLVAYDSAVEIFDHDLKSKHYYWFGIGVDHATFDERYLFYSVGNKLCIRPRHTTKDTILFELNAQIETLQETDDRQLKVFTGRGFALLDLNTFRISHYLESGFVGEEKASVYGDKFSYSWIGIHNGYYFGNEARYEMELAIRSTNTGIRSEADPIMLRGRMISASALLANHNGLHKIYELDPEGKPSELFEFDLSQTDLPNVVHDQPLQPAGLHVRSFVRDGDMFYIGTELGLYIFNLKSRQWRSHFISSSYIAFDRGFAVNDTTIYGFSDMTISRIDRETNQNWYYYWLFNGVNPESCVFQNGAIACANEHGLIVFDQKTQQTLTIPTSVPVQKVELYKDSYLAAGDNDVLSISKDGQLKKRWKLTDQNVNEAWPNPQLIKLDGDFLWVNARTRLNTHGLTLLSLTTGAQTRYFFPESEVRKILSDQEYTWLIGSAYIYRYSKQDATFQILGYIKDPFVDQPFRNAYIRDAAANGNTIFFVTDIGVFSLNKKTLEIRRSTHPLTQVYISHINIEKNKYFLSFWNGILQIDETAFTKSFSAPATLSSYRKEDIGTLLPLTKMDTILIHDPSDRHLFHFTLKDELAHHKVLTDSLRAEEYLKFEFNDEVLKEPGMYMMDQVKPIETLFFVSLAPETIRRNRNNWLRVIDRKKNIVLKEWLVIVR